MESAPEAIIIFGKSIKKASSDVLTFILAKLFKKTKKLPLEDRTLGKEAAEPLKYDIIH